jgi:glycosyltransferase involved in cell wall biosynthesis
VTSVASVAICVVTFRRARGLARLLRALDDLDTAGIDVRVIVVDNDHERSAASVVEDWARTTAFRSTYVTEARRGLSYVRNTALSLATAEPTDWVVWFDDDEAPRPDWLRRVVATQAVTDADVVMGPSAPIFPDGAPPWLASTDLYGTGHFDSGSPFPYFHARTSGVLVRVSAMPDEGFDERLALIGGEDRLYFTRMHRAGCRFIWDDDAVADEWVPLSRMNVGWLMRRWFRTGITRSLTLLYLDEPSWSRRLRRVGGGLVVLCRGLLATLIALPAGRRAALEASRGILLGAGVSLGALGFRYREYRKVHGQ